jgi:hypothetical protein
LRLLCEDGTEWKVGEFPEQKKPAKEEKRRERGPRLRSAKGTVYGHLTDVMKPWIVLAMENPQEVIKIRAEDVDGETLVRCSGAFASIIGCYMGPRNTTTWRAKDDEGEEVLFVKYTGPRIERHALEYLRKGVVVPHLHANFLARNAVTTASRSDAKQEK